MSGIEFMIWAVIYSVLIVTTVMFVAAWRDHDDDLKK